jgi:hypothetical protein
VSTLLLGIGKKHNYRSVLNRDTIWSTDRCGRVTFDASSNIVSTISFIDEKAALNGFVNPNFKISGFYVSQFGYFQNPVA